MDLAKESSDSSLADLDAKRFSKDMETRYLRQRLQFARSHVRIWFTLSTVLSIALTPFNTHGNALLLTMMLVHVLSVAILCGLAWSPLYFRFYPPAARILVPEYLAGVVYFVVGAMNQGQGQALANLAVIAFANYFLAGLSPRAAAAAGATVLIAFGVIGWWSHLSANLMTSGLITLAVSFALGVIVTRDIESNRRRRFLERALIAELVARDPLSGLKNRRAFDEHLERLWKSAAREGGSLALLLIDIDHFKTYNDVHGHQAGDAALRAVAQALKELARRPLDMAARYGGEEFALLLSDVSATEAQEIGERGRQAVALMAARELRPNDGRPVSVSIGVAHLLPSASRGAHTVVQLADEALYDAKARGRNCVIFKDQQDYDALNTGAFRKSAGATA